MNAKYYQISKKAMLLFIHVGPEWTASNFCCDFAAPCKMTANKPKCQKEVHNIKGKIIVFGSNRGREGAIFILI